MQFEVCHGLQKVKLLRVVSIARRFGRLNLLGWVETTVNLSLCPTF